MLSPKYVVVDGVEQGDEDGFDVVEDECFAEAVFVDGGTVVSRIEPNDEMDMMVRHTTKR